LNPRVVVACSRAFASVSREFGSAKCVRGFDYTKCSELSSKTVAVHQYNKTSFLVQIKFITEDSK
jgi:hypothetical protein